MTATGKVLFAVLVLACLASPAFAGYSIYSDKADFLNQAVGMFVDVYFEYYTDAVVDAGFYLNSVFYPTGFSSSTVPLVDSGMVAQNGDQLDFTQGYVIPANGASVPIGLVFQFLGSNTFAAGLHLSTTPGYGPVPGNYRYVFSYINGQSNDFNEVQGSTAFVGVINGNGAPIQEFLARFYGLSMYGSPYNVVPAINHVVVEAQYLSSGGDPHIKSSVIDAILPGLAANDHVNLFAHPKASVNARLRSFDFLDFEHATYYGAVGVRLANGDRVVVEALEADDGTPDFKVTVNGAPMAKHSALSVEAGDASYEVHYDAHGNVPHGRDVSVFHRDYPYMTHEALVRVHMPGVVAIDIDLASKDAFVDWHRPKPVVYRQAGAFLNVAVRDLVQESRSEAAGLLKVTDHMQRAKLAIEAKAAEELAAGDDTSHARATEAKSRIDNMLDDIVAKHRVDSLFD